MQSYKHFPKKIVDKIVADFVENLCRHFYDEAFLLDAFNTNNSIRNRSKGEEEGAVTLENVKELKQALIAINQDNHEQFAISIEGRGQGAYLKEAGFSDKELAELKLGPSTILIYEAAVAHAFAIVEEHFIKQNLQDAEGIVRVSEQTIQQATDMEGSIEEQKKLKKFLFLLAKKIIKIDVDRFKHEENCLLAFRRCADNDKAEWVKAFDSIGSIRDKEYGAKKKFASAQELEDTLMHLHDDKSLYYLVTPDRLGMNLVNNLGFAEIFDGPRGDKIISHLGFKEIENKDKSEKEQNGEETNIAKSQNNSALQKLFAKINLKNNLIRYEAFLFHAIGEGSQSQELAILDILGINILGIKEYDILLFSSMQFYMEQFRADLYQLIKKPLQQMILRDLRDEKKARLAKEELADTEKKEKEQFLDIFYSCFIDENKMIEAFNGYASLIQVNKGRGYEDYNNFKTIQELNAVLQELAFPTDMQGTSEADDNKGKDKQFAPRYTCKIGRAQKTLREEIGFSMDSLQSISLADQLKVEAAISFARSEVIRPYKKKMDQIADEETALLNRGEFYKRRELILPKYEQLQSKVRSVPQNTKLECIDIVCVLALGSTTELPKVSILEGLKQNGEQNKKISLVNMLFAQQKEFLEKVIQEETAKILVDYVEDCVHEESFFSPKFSNMERTLNRFIKEPTETNGVFKSNNINVDAVIKAVDPAQSSSNSNETPKNGENKDQKLDLQNRASEKLRNAVHNYKKINSLSETLNSPVDGYSKFLNAFKKEKKDINKHSDSVWSRFLDCVDDVLKGLLYTKGFNKSKLMFWRSPEREFTHHVEEILQSSVRNR